MKSQVILQLNLKLDKTSLKYFYIMKPHKLN